MSALKLGVLVLAGGLSTRLQGENKLLKLWREHPMIVSVFGLATSVAAHQKAVVVHRDEDLVLALLPQAETWLRVYNPDSQNGLASSLCLGLATLRDCNGVLVLLGDMPDVSATTLAALTSYFSRDTYAIVPTYQGQWGNPVMLGTHAIGDCARLTGDQGARKILMMKRDYVTLVETNDPAILIDFDTHSDFASV